MAGIVDWGGVPAVWDVLDWWDGAELWLTGRGFVLQTIIVIPVALALAYGIARVLDTLLGWGQRALHVLRHDEEPPL